MQFNCKRLIHSAPEFFNNIDPKRTFGRVVANRRRQAPRPELVSRALGYSKADRILRQRLLRPPLLLVRKQG
jgi:hypothetical protein